MSGDIPTEERGLPTLIRDILAFMSPVRRRQLVLLVLLMIAGAAAEIFTIGSVVPLIGLLAGSTASAVPARMAEVVEGIVQTTGLDPASAAAALFITGALAATALRLGLSWKSQSFTLGLGHELSVDVQERVLHQPYLFHTAQHSSRILASLEKVQILASGVLLQLVQAASALVIGLCIVAALASIDAATTAIAAIALGSAYLLASTIARPLLARNSAILGKAFDRRLKAIQESLGSIRDVILDHSQAAHLDEFRKIDREFTHARLASGFLVTAPRYLVEAAAMVLIALLAVALASGPKGLTGTLPVLGALAVGGLRLLPLLQQLYQAWASLAANRSVVGEILSLRSLPLSAHEAPTPPLALHHEILLDQLSFKYPGRDRPALDRVDLRIARGSRVAIVGKTGSGKSTLADLLMGLLAPSEGAISIDGRPLDDTRRRAWQRSVAHVPQSIFLADTSIARNIALASESGPVEPERLARALCLAQLQEFVSGLPRGVDTPVGERGVALSGGQRQRLGLARAIYKDAPVLIFDEATNALDDETEAAVVRALDQLQAQGRTIFIISHRASSLRECDMIVRLDQGKLVSVECCDRATSVAE